MHTEFLGAKQEHRITAHEQLFQDGHRRNMLQEEYAHWCAVIHQHALTLRTCGVTIGVELGETGQSHNNTGRPVAAIGLTRSPDDQSSDLLHCVAKQSTSYSVDASCSAMLPAWLSTC